MLFNSIDFLIFFPTVTLIFFIIPAKLRCIWLLVSSYYFYMNWNPKYAMLIAISTVITFISGLLMEIVNNLYSKKLILIISVVSNLAILVVYKYTNFILQTLSFILQYLGLGIIDKRVDLLLSVGISFYTFQALSYTIDVYRGTIKAEKNILKYALFVSFFPQLVAGPIERSGSLLIQIQKIQEKKLWKFERIRDGILLMLWGLFQKLVVADRASILVNQVYENYQNYGFFELIIATILFAVQIYCDFGGYSNIACGVAQVMGFSLMKNFQQPYLAINIKEFWRRWHISLTTWFTDYLYIPLGGNRKGIFRKYINICIVFIISGLWHGASWHFIVWGIIHAFYQIIGDLRIKLESKIISNKSLFVRKLRKRIITFVLIDFAWIFFAADSLHHAYYIFRQMILSFHTLNIREMGLDKENWIVLIVGIVILIIVEIIHEEGNSIFDLVNQRKIGFRWILYLGLIWFIIMFGIYGTEYDSSQFIYFQF